MAIEREVEPGVAEASAMILAAGYGTRLRPLTATRAKTMVPFLNRPLLDYGLDWLQRCGFRRVLINLHHLPATVIDAYRDHRFDLDIQFNVEASILGTAGGPRDVLDRLGERVLIVNGDIATSMALGPLWQRHLESGALATLALHDGPGAAPHPRVEIAEDGRVVRIPGAGSAGADGGGTAAGCFAGVHIVERRLLETVPQGLFCGIVDPLYAGALDAGLPLYAAVVPGSWYEIGTLERYRVSQLEALRREDFSFAFGECRRLARGGWVRGRAGWMRAGLVPPFFLDEAVHIEEGALLEASIAGKRAWVGCGATVRDSILMERAWVGAGATLERCIVMEGAVVAPGTHRLDAVIAPAAAQQAG